MVGWTRRNRERRERWREHAKVCKGAECWCQQPFSKRTKIELGITLLLLIVVFSFLLFRIANQY